MSFAALMAETDAMLAAIPEPEDLRSHADIILARFDEVDRKLVALGFPATSPWWRACIERWYRSGRRQLVGRIGRRGGKSSTLSRLAVVEAVYGRHDVPPGDVGFVAIISTDRPEALGRLRTVEAILDALGVAYRPCRGGVVGIELVGRRTGFRVFTATIKGVSGFTGIFVLCDEVAKWADADTGANPAAEVLASVRPTMKTMPHARMVLSSSPMSTLDAHYDAYELGETDLQVVAQAPSWVANPTITEADCITEEPDEAKRAREYGAIPQAEAESSLLTDYLCERARRRIPQHWDLPYVHGHRYVAAMDPATRGNAWTLVIATKGSDGVRRMALAREWRGSPSRPLSPKAIMIEIQGHLAAYGLRWVTTDQAAVDYLKDLCPRGVSLREAPWTQASKAVAYEHLLKIAQSDAFEMHPDPQVKADLLGIRKCFTRTGVQYVLAEVHGRHADYAPSAALAVDDARFAAKDPEAELDTEGDAQKAKVTFLEGRRKERERRERFGALPVTHQKVRVR